MAKSGKKQGEKTSVKKPASFSKSATAKKPVAKKTTAKKPVAKKTTAKKPVAKKTTAKKPVAKKTTQKVPKKVEQKSTGFEEFETLKLNNVTTNSAKLESKIIVRDVEREAPITVEPKVVAPKVAEPKAAAPVTAPEPLPVFHPVSQPRPVAAPVKIPAKELKQQEIEKAVKAATNITTSEKRRKRNVFGEFGWTRVLLATACITTAVFAIAYFVNLASSDMSIQVAAAQSGIDAKYPSYIPRGYEVSDVTSGSGKVSMHFKSDEGEFGLTEEATTWDSDALLNNYVKPNYGNDYTVVREQGLTLYVGGNWQAWVNGGILYKLTVTSGTLSKKQMKTIATSL